MKVRLSIEVADAERFVIAKSFAAAAQRGTADRRRRRATRKQVRRFAAAALQTAVKEQAQGLSARSRSAARRLMERDQRVFEIFPEQGSLEW